MNLKKKINREKGGQRGRRPSRGRLAKRAGVSTSLIITCPNVKETNFQNINEILNKIRSLSHQFTICLN